MEYEANITIGNSTLDTVITANSYAETIRTLWDLYGVSIIINEMKVKVDD